eukprot:6742894-Prymnesium_polylepis.1
MVSTASAGVAAQALLEDFPADVRHTYLASTAAGCSPGRGARWSRKRSATAHAQREGVCRSPPRTERVRFFLRNSIRAY